MNQASFLLYLISRIFVTSKYSARYLDDYILSLEQKGKIFISFLLMSFSPASSAYFTFSSTNFTGFSLSLASSISISFSFRILSCR